MIPFYPSFRNFIHPPAPTKIFYDVFWVGLRTQQMLELCLNWLICFWHPIRETSAFKYLRRNEWTSSVSVFFCSDHVITANPWESGAARPGNASWLLLILLPADDFSAKLQSKWDNIISLDGPGSVIASPTLGFQQKRRTRGTVRNPGPCCLQ